MCCNGCSAVCLARCWTWLQRCLPSLLLHPAWRKNGMNGSRRGHEWRENWDFKETGRLEIQEASQRCLDCAALVECRLLSYLTLLCNTGSIPPQACTIFLSCFLTCLPLWTSLVLTFVCFQSLALISCVFARLVLFSRPPSTISPALSHACRPPLSRCHPWPIFPYWLFLRLPKPMPGRDWWSRVGMGHAGSVSMWEAGKHMVQQTSGLGG